MTSMFTKSSFLITVTGIVLALVAGGAFADKPDWADGGKHKEGKERDGRGHDGNRQGGVPAFGFGNDDRRIVN